MKKNFLIVFFCLLNLVAAADSIDIFFGPEGGFNPVNNQRMLKFPDGSVKKATLANALVHKFYQLEPDSVVKIAMYSMSDYQTLDVMIEICREKNIQFKLLLDGAAVWSAASRDKIVEKVKKARDEAWAANKEFNFQIAITTAEAMKRNGREQLLDDGKLIWGTMHEKFGIFYRVGNPVPHSCFCGSANISVTSDKIYAENRVFFDDQPAVARQFQEEFARLWNEYSTVILGPGTPEKYLEVDPVEGYATVVFNAEPVSETELTRIDNALINMIRRVKPDGRLDLAMFSFTRPELAEAVLRSAERNPDAKFRLLFDHAQIDDANPEESKLAPWFEKKVAELGLKNVEVRYRFRRNAYSFSQEEKKPMLISYLNLFLHHKTLLINGNEMALGSYNWSGSAEYLNFENVMFFNGNYTDHQKVIDSFMAEIEVLWNSPMNYKPFSRPEKGKPRTVSLAEGKKLHNSILKMLQSESNCKVLAALDREAFKDYSQLLAETGLPVKQLKKSLGELKKHLMIVEWQKDGKAGFSQAD
ncbi:MAG: phospholipase D-like domain-containing protein [Candidatus Riflebacteria bacterium]